MKYFDNPEDYVCPRSDDIPLTLTSAEKDDPRLFRWDRDSTLKASSAPPLDPIFDKAGDPKIADNSSLSYSYVKRKLNAASVRSDTILSADKAIRFDAHFDSPALTSAPPGPIGCHDDGLNILYADGHVAFVGLSNMGDAFLSEPQRCAEKLQLEGCDSVLKSRIKTLSEKVPPTPAVIAPVTSESGGD